VALACSDPPEGKKRWNMRLLADRLVEVGVVDETFDETLRRTLKKGHQTVGQAAVVHPGSGSAICVARGGCPRSLRGTLRSPSARGLLRRRARLPAHRRCERAFAAKSRPTSKGRLALREERHLLTLYGLGASHWLARGATHRTQEAAGIHSFNAVPCGENVPASREHLSSVQQPLDTHGGFFETFPDNRPGVWPGGSNPSTHRGMDLG
jgi:hypothetical protein